MSQTRANDILAAALNRGWTVTCAESCTGGLVAAALTEVPGSSAIFERGFVTYSNAAKQEMLGVSPKSLTDHGAVSETVALQMAEGAARQAGAQVAVAISGIAGPGGSDFKPEGRVCFACISPTGPHVETIEFGAIGRGNVRHKACEHALNLILSALSQT